MPREQPAPTVGKSSLPVLEKILRVEGRNFVAGAIFRRERGYWRCVGAAPILNWMTRVRHMEIIGAWLRKNQYEFQWLKGHTACAARWMQAEDKPAEAYPLRDASPAQADNTNASLKNDTQADQQRDYRASSCLEQNGLSIPRCLITSGCPEELKASPRL